VATRATLDDLHAFIEYGELLLGELASDPYRFAPPKSIVRLEDWLFFLTSRLFPGVVAFLTTGSQIPVKPDDFSYGPMLSTVLRHLDQASIEHCLVLLNRSIEEYNCISPLRRDPRPVRPNSRNRRLIVIEDEDAGDMHPTLDDSYDQWLDSKNRLEQEIVQRFDAFLEPFRSFERLLAERLATEEGEDKQWSGSGDRGLPCELGDTVLRSHAPFYSPGPTVVRDVTGPAVEDDPKTSRLNDGLNLPDGLDHTETGEVKDWIKGSKRAITAGLGYIGSYATAKLRDLEKDGEVEIWEYKKGRWKFFFKDREVHAQVKDFIASSKKSKNSPAKTVGSRKASA
jgi:hypothetical protein